MKQQSAKRSSDVRLSGVSVEFVVRDGSIAEVRLTDDVGNECTITAANSYSTTLNVYVPATPKMVKKARLSGVIMGVSVSEDFEEQYEAERRLKEIDENLRDGSATELKVEEIEVPEDEVPF